MNAQTTESAGQLLPLDSINAVEVFTGSGAALDDILARIRAETATLVPDVSTEAGRKLIASTAYKVARSKTAIDDAGKSLVEGWKTQAKVVDNARKKARDYLDNLRDEIRAPLDAWEAEEKRKEQELIEAARLRREAEEAERLAEIERKERELREREERIAAAERAEAERIAAERAAAERAEREEQIRMEAEERAQREAAEAVARAEREVQEAREAAKRAAEQAEFDRIAAEKAAKEAQERAVREAEERARRQAEEAERARQAEEQRQRQEQERREANRRHVGAVNRKAANALMGHGALTDEQARTVITLIAIGKVPAVAISY